jgi:hypothetical protein
MKTTILKSVALAAILITPTALRAQEATPSPVPLVAPTATPAELTTEQKQAVTARRIDGIVRQALSGITRAILALREQVYSNPMGLSQAEVEAAIGADKTTTLRTLDDTLTSLINAPTVAPGTLPTPPPAE